jgi:hypothetical protein
MTRLGTITSPLLLCVVFTAFLAPAGPSAAAPAADKKEDLWVLKPVVRPPVPSAAATSNPIDAFIASEYSPRGLRPVPKADKLTLLRRVCLDLTGIPPTPAEQQAFLDDTSPNAYEKVVDRLLASEQHGVRYARHWLDVLRYADSDERMIAAAGLYLWRDWLIHALNDNIPYDQFVRAQLTGQRAAERTQMTATGVRIPVEPRVDDLFALGFLARGHVLRDGKDAKELAITAVETVSTAFMGLTVGCAKCHDHMYDPIKKRDFYSMKALFDPLVLKKVPLAAPTDLFTAGRAQGEADRKRAAAQKPIEDLINPYRKRLYDERVAMLPDEVRAVILKPERQRTPQEQKVADDYFPVLRIDGDKINEILPEADRKRLRELERERDAATGGGGGGGANVPSFWTVESDPKKELEKNYELTSGDPDRPELNHEVGPGWPFAANDIDFREGRREAFSDWLTAPQNPLFARVAINRLWQWHFGEGLQKLPSDFGNLGGTPSNPALLDWLASEFADRKFSMKQMHKLMVMSETYQLASTGDADLVAANTKTDPANTYLWRFRLQRLEAEPIWDSILTAAGDLDLTVGGPSFEPASAAGGGGGGAGRRRGGGMSRGGLNRRGAYIARGYSPNRDVTSTFLQAFDVDDGRTPCPLRTQTVTAPQSLFLMNSPEIDRAADKFAQRILKDANSDLPKAIDLGYRTALARAPSPAESHAALDYLEGKPDRMKGLAWLLFNLDEFIYAR